MAVNIMDWRPGPASHASGPYLSNRGSSRGSAKGQADTATPGLPWLKEKVFKTLLFFLRGKGEQMKRADEGGAMNVGLEKRPWSCPPAGDQELGGNASRTPGTSVVRVP